MRIYKQADKKSQRIPDGETLALYVGSLKLYLSDNPDIDSGTADLIEKLPAPREIRQNFSKQECKIIYETVEYLWTKITKNPIVSEKEIIKAPESLQGSYWMMSGGILLKNVNHYTCIKQNGLMICSLLGISGMAFQEYLSRKPNDIIALVLKYGGIRLFISKDKKLYAQMSQETYRDWGLTKLRKLDFPTKIVRIIDFKVPYEGWKNGVLVRI